MALTLNRSFVPRIAVQKTILRGIELYEKVHGPATDQIKNQIRDFIYRQATILNMQAALKDDETAESERILYKGPRAEMNR